MSETILSCVISVPIIICVILVCRYRWQKQALADKAENKSGSNEYIYKRNEKPGTLGGTNLDRFFIECVLSKCNDLSLEKNKKRAQLLANKYNLSYGSGIEALYQEALHEHVKMSSKILQDKMDTKREYERKQFNSLTKYSEYCGKEKTLAMLTDSMEEMLAKAKLLDKNAELIARSGQIKESDWAVWGGAASGIAGVGAGLATAMDIQAKNAQIRAQNEATRKANMPLQVYVTNNAYDSRRRAREAQEQIDRLNMRLISDMSTNECFELLSFSNVSLRISETGAFTIHVTAKTKEPIYIYDDVPAVVDGTIIAHLSYDNCEVGSAKMVLPVSGLPSGKIVFLTGICLSGAQQCKEKEYNISFTPYRLWLIEK